MVLLDLDMPAVLKRALLDDYDAVVEEGRLQPLPRRPSVAGLLQKYVTDVGTVHMWRRHFVFYKGSAPGSV